MTSALHFYSKTIEIDPFYTGAYYNRALIYSELGSSSAVKSLQFLFSLIFTQALTDYTAAVKLNPFHVMAHNNRGWCLQSSGPFADCALCLLVQGKTASGLADFLFALEVDDGYKLSTTNKSDLLRLFPSLQTIERILQREIAQTLDTIRKIIQRRKFTFLNLINLKIPFDFELEIADLSIPLNPPQFFLSEYFLLMSSNNKYFSSNYQGSLRFKFEQTISSCLAQSVNSIFIHSIVLQRSFRAWNSNQPPKLRLNCDRNVAMIFALFLYTDDLPVSLDLSQFRDLMQIAHQLDIRSLKDALALTLQTPPFNPLQPGALVLDDPQEILEIARPLDCKAVADVCLNLLRAKENSNHSAVPTVSIAFSSSTRD